MAKHLLKRTGLLLAVCAGLALLVLASMPAEKTLGQIIKIVYLHGALSRAGMIGLIASGAAGLAYLLARRRSALANWSSALLVSGWVFWTAHFIVSMPATRLTWGPWIAWGEPRVTMTLQIMAAGLTVFAVSRLVCSATFSAAANGLLGSAVLLMAAGTGVLRHPLDPIGSSPSDLLRFAYALLLLPLIVAMVLVARRLTLSTLAICQSNEDETRSNPTEA